MIDVAISERQRVHIRVGVIASVLVVLLVSQSFANTVPSLAGAS